MTLVLTCESMTDLSLFQDILSPFPIRHIVRGENPDRSLALA